MGCGKVRQARRGTARQGMARIGKVGHGAIRQAWRVAASYGVSGWGVVCLFCK